MANYHPRVGFANRETIHKDQIKEFLERRLCKVKRFNPQTLNNVEENYMQLPGI